MNRLVVGTEKVIEPPPYGGFLLIDDTADWMERIPDAVLFDVREDGFNPLKNVDHIKAREIAEILYNATPGGKDTLTVRNGKRALVRLLLESRRLDRVKGDEEAEGMIQDVLVSPLARRVLCSSSNVFSFSKGRKIVAKLDRAELGDFDALVLGLFLIGQFQGQVIVPDFGFYGRELHTALIRQSRLIAGVNFLSELSPRLRSDVLLIKQKEGQGCIYEDAELLAKYARLAPGTVGFSTFVEKAIA